MTRKGSTSHPRSSARRQLLRACWALLAAAGLIASAGGAQSPVEAGDVPQGNTDGTYYSYVFALDGSATLYAAQSDAQHEVETNLPVLEGDRLYTDGDTRLSVFLSDGTLLTMDSETDVVLQSIFNSPDSSTTDTILRLLSGRILLHVDSADSLPAIDTGNARVYAQSAGVYVVSANDTDWTHVIVREGFAEILDQRGSSLVRQGEEIEVEGDSAPRTRLGTASRVTSLEDWALDAVDRSSLASDPSLDEPIYNTASLGDHGDWVDVEGTRAWRPSVASTWRPYWQGRWWHTPRGLYWVSADPWASTYHYGTWDHHTRLGWLWYPGYAYAPAHVYWYWGPSYTAWVPYGYYTRFYRPRFAGFGFGGFGFRWGHYGWAGGTWNPFYDWVFCPTRYFGYRNQYRYHDYGYRLRRRGALERGFITTDTRRITPDRWNRHDLVRRTFDDDLRGRRIRSADLPDVNDFLSRKELSEPLRNRIVVTDDATPRLGSRRGARSAVDTLVTPRGGTRSATRQGLTPSRRSTADRGGALEAARGRTPVTPRAGSRDRSSSTARRVLDGVRGRSSVPAARGTSPSARSRAPRSATPRSATPRSATPRTSPQASPRRATPAPRRATPPSASPRSRTAVPRSRPQATPRSTSPRSRSASPPSRSASPRSRSTPPRSARPRSSTPPRVSSPRSSSPRPSARSSGPRSVSPRSSSPRSASPRSSSPRTSPRRSTPPASARRSTPPPRSVPSPRAAQPRTSTRSTPSVRRSSAPTRPSVRSTPLARRSTPSVRSSRPSVRSSSPRSSAPRVTSPRSSSPRASSSRSSAPRRSSASRSSAPRRSSASRSSAPRRSSSASRSSSSRSSARSATRSSGSRSARRPPGR